MINHVKIESIREGTYLLWRLGYREEARQFALGRHDDLTRCNAILNKKIENESVASKGNIATLRRLSLLQNRYRERLIHESQIAWLRDDAAACVYFWLYMYQNHSSSEDDDILNKILPVSRTSRRRQPRDRRSRKDLAIQRSELPVINVSNPRECLTAALSLMDLLPLFLNERNDILDIVNTGYQRAKEHIKSDFSWFNNAEKEHVIWTWNKFKENDRLINGFETIHLGPDVISIAVPFIFYLWSERHDTKYLFLSSFRKRFANMKHREKVADKEPVNIRISKGAKKTLGKLEKRFNRNRADVIEYLIEKAWAELNQKN